MTRKDLISIARPLAPEDIRRGAYVATLEVIEQHLPLCISDGAIKTADSPVKTAWLPCGGNDPMKVIDVCLPFVLVRQPCGAVRTLDVRSNRLARLDEAYARRAVRRLAAPTKKARAKRRR